MSFGSRPRNAPIRSASASTPACSLRVSFRAGATVSSIRSSPSCGSRPPPRRRRRPGTAFQPDPRSGPCRVPRPARALREDECSRSRKPIASTSSPAAGAPSAAAQPPFARPARAVRKSSRAADGVKLLAVNHSRNWRWSTGRTSRRSGARPRGARRPAPTRAPARASSSVRTNVTFCLTGGPKQEDATPRPRRRGSTPSRTRAARAAQADTRDDGIRQLLAGQPAATERLADRRHDLGHVRELLIGLTDDRPTGRGPRRELVGRMEMERAAKGPRLRQRPLLPESLPDIRLGDPLEPRRELQLRRPHHLRVDPADVAHDVDEPLGRRPLEQMIAGDAPRAHLVPGQRGQGRPSAYSTAASGLSARPAARARSSSAGGIDSVRTKTVRS